MRRRTLLAFLLSALAAFAAVPRKSPDFTVTLPDGKTVSLSSYRGKVVCFLFILTT